MRHEAYVFLDVSWLASILKPLLNHKEKEGYDGSVRLGDTGDTRISLTEERHITSWRRLKTQGVLEPDLANVMWPGLADYVLPTLASLALTFPLVHDPAEGLVVLLRLGVERPESVGQDIDAFRQEHTAVLSVCWKMFLGVPPGAIEKILTRCCSIGAVQTFWRFGVLVQGYLGRKDTGGRFVLLLEYSHKTTELEMKVYGSVGTTAPWAALSYGLSAVLAIVLEFPGLRWRAHLSCPEHNGEDFQINKVSSQALA